MGESISDTESANEIHLFGDYSGRLLTLLAVGTMLTMNGRLVLSPLLPTIIDGLSITPFRAGLALSAMWSLTALCQYLGGRLADRLSRKTVLAAGLGLLIAGFLSLTTATTYGLFLLGTAVVGIGAGLFPPAAYVNVADLYVEQRGKAFGVLSAANDLGGALASPLAVAVLAVAAWRVAFPPVLIGLAAVFVVLHRWSREPYVFSWVRLNLRETGAHLFGDGRVRRLILVASLFGFVWQGTASFLPTYLQVDKGFSPGLANGAFSALFLVGMVARPISGELGDRFGHSTVATAMTGVAVVGLTAVVAAPTVLLTGIGVLVFAVGLAAFWPVVQAHFMGLYPDASMGGDFGATRSVYIGLGSLGPTYVGFVAERVDYATAFVGLTVCLLCSTALMAWLAASQR